MHPLIAKYPDLAARLQVDLRKSRKAGCCEASSAENKYLKIAMSREEILKTKKGPR